MNGQRLMRHLIRSMCDLAEMTHANEDGVTLYDYAVEWFERLIMKLIANSDSYELSKKEESLFLNVI